LLLFKVSAGTLYEFFNEDAHTAARVLGLTVTARNRCSDGPIPLVSFAADQLDGNLRRLVEAGYRVAVCEQIDKAPAGKPVTRIVTAGELVEAAGLLTAAQTALTAFRQMYAKMEAGAESDEILEDETLWPLTQLREAIDAGPELVGIWVVACNSHREFIKWGLDGDTEFPFPPAQEDEALAQARYVTDSDRLLRVHILHVFNNGQIKQFDFEE